MSSSSRIDVPLTFLKLSIAGLVAIAFSAEAATINVSTATQLQNALKNASPGDEIVVAPGTYVGNKGTSGYSVAHFFSDRSGTSSNKITLRSQSNTNKAKIGGDDNASGYGFYLTGNHWIIKNIKVKTAQKGVLLDNADNNLLDNIEVYDTGAEAVHFRKGSSNNFLKNCYIHDTGKRANKPGFGEGVYVGSHKGDEPSVADYSNNNYIGGCTIGPNVKAEAFDVKAGSVGTVIESNYINANGIIGENSGDSPAADSFIDLKGDKNIVRGNKMDFNGDSDLTHAILTNDAHKTSNIYDNEFRLPNSGFLYKLLEAKIHLSNNKRLDSGSQFLEASYQDDHYDYTLDSSIEKPYRGPYTCFNELSSGCGSVPPTSGPSPLPSSSSSSGGFGGSFNLPGKIEAEKYTAAPSESSNGNANTSGVTACTYYGLNVDVQNTSDDSTCNVGWTTAGEKLDYKIGSAGGTYNIQLRVASAHTGKQVRVRVNGSSVGTVTVPGNGWQSFSTVALSGKSIPSNATLQVEFVHGSVNINYINVVSAGSTSSSSSSTGSTSSSSTSSSSSGGSGACLSYSGSDKKELNLSSTDCVDFSGGLSGKTVQVWDSDTNASCDFRGTVTSTNGSGTMSVSSNYVSSSSFTGSTLKFAASNGCKYVKVRRY